MTSLSDKELEPSSAILATQAEIVETFSLFDDWTDRYQYIIDLGRKLPDLPPEQKTEDNRLKGCQSQVWMAVDTREGKLHIAAISDSAIVSGLIALVLNVYSGHRPQDILATPPNFVHDIGLDAHLSPTRSNGLAAMIQQIRQFAVAAITQSDSESPTI